MRFLAILRIPALLAATLTMAACGGGGGDDDTTTIGPPASITITPTTLSIDQGQVSTIVVTVRDANSNVINNAQVTLTSSNPAIVSFSTNGLTSFPITAALCGGTWDSQTTPVVCTAGAVGTSNIRASVGSIQSDPLVVSVHTRVANVVVNIGAGTCVSQDFTRQFTAQAFDPTGVDVTATVGTFTWLSADSSIALAETNGSFRGLRPGSTNIFAILNNVTSLPVTFETCPPASILIQEANSNPPVTALTIAPQQTRNLSATVVDTMGNPIRETLTVGTTTLTGILLTWTAADGGVVLTTQSNQAAGNLIAGGAPGQTVVIASCTPPTCNSGIGEAVYSNSMQVTVTGTSATTVYATGAGATTIVPIPTTTNTPGAVINLPQFTINGTQTRPVINSMVFSGDHTRLILGSDIAIMSLDTSTNAFASNAFATGGRVLAVNRDGTRFLISNLAGTQALAVNASDSTSTLLPIAGATRAAFTPDGHKAFILAGNTLYVYSPVLPLRTLPLAATANDVAILGQGSVAALAGGVASGFNLRAVCDNTTITDVATAATPLLVEQHSFSNIVYGTDGTNLFAVTTGATTAPCPPGLAPGLTTVNLGAGAFTPRQLIVANDGEHVAILSEQANVLIYDTVAGTTDNVPLINGATSAVRGGVVLDGTVLYVGAAGSNDVQRIVLGANTVTTIPVNLVNAANQPVAPDLLAVRLR